MKHMKKNCLVFFCFFICFHLKSQVYTVGVPVHDTMEAGSFTINSVNCVSGEVTVDNLLINNMPSGVNLYFKITSSQFSPGCLNFTNVGPMNAGDSTLITTSQSQFEWYSVCGTGSAHYAILAEGIPLAASDSFFCLAQWHTSGAVLIDGCSPYVMFNYYAGSLTPGCVVDTSVATFVNEWSPSDFSIYPNPFSSQTTISSNHYLENATLTICDVFGKRVKQTGNIFGQTIILGRENLPAGPYFIRLNEGDKSIYIGKLIVLD